MKAFLNETLIFFSPESSGTLIFTSCQNCMSSANLVTAIYQNLWNEKALSNGEHHTCEYVTLL